MLGTIVLRGDGIVLAIVADDLDVPAGAPSTWQVRLILASDGMRLEAPATLGEKELPKYAELLDELVRGGRSAATLTTEDGSLGLTIERRSEAEVGVAVRILRERDTGLYSVVETRAARRDVADFARRARKFPH